MLVQYVPESSRLLGVDGGGTIDCAGNKETLIIRRLRCHTQTCRRIHHELPDRVIPYKRHCAETVEKIVSGDVDDVCCDFVTESRIRTWWDGLYMYFKGVLVSLQMKYGVVFSSRLTPREIVRAVVNANYWVHTRSASMPG
ncbi:MAG: DUF6431 domain-containing protein [Oscillospiraceae bacterium]|nr:DUF6431 domain-containing protein [Oscillospiraceae bacterium]